MTDRAFLDETIASLQSFRRGGWQRLSAPLRGEGPAGEPVPTIEHGVPATAGLATRHRGQTCLRCHVRFNSPTPGCISERPRFREGLWMRKAARRGRPPVGPPQAPLGRRGRPSARKARSFPETDSPGLRPEPVLNDCSRALRDTLRQPSEAVLTSRGCGPGALH